MMRPHAGDALVGQTFFVRYSLLFFQEPPEVFPDWIYFIKKPVDCDTDPGATATIYTGESVKVVGITDIGAFVSVKIESARSGCFYELYLKKQSSGGLGKAIDRAFSKAPVATVDNSSCDPKTISELVRCYGYPIYQCRQGDVTIFHYNEPYIGHRIGGFHSVWFKIKGDKVVDLYGWL